MCIYTLPFSDSTADVMVKQGPFSLDDPKDYSVDVRISDGGRPIQTSITKLTIKVSVCFTCGGCDVLNCLRAEKC